MVRLLLLGGLYAVAAFAAVEEHVVEGALPAVDMVAAPPAPAPAPVPAINAQPAPKPAAAGSRPPNAQDGIFGLPSLSDIPGISALTSLSDSFSSWPTIGDLVSPWLPFPIPGLGPSQPKTATPAITMIPSIPKASASPAVAAASASASAEIPATTADGPGGLPSFGSGFGSFLEGLLGGFSSSPRTSKAVWQPAVGAPWQIILAGTLDVKPTVQSSVKGTNPSAKPMPLLSPEKVEIFDIDLWENPTETVEKLHSQGKKVICYFSAGTSEDWRPDYKQFRSADMGAKLPLWKGERWLDVRSRNVWKIMQKRIELASKRGCDAIDPDNVDGFDNEKGGGFYRPLTKNDAVTYVRKLAKEAKRYGMGVGLKNAVGIIKAVESDINFAVNEECAQLKECDAYKSFLSPGFGKPGKPVFHIEYVKLKTLGKPRIMTEGVDLVANEAVDNVEIYNAGWPNATTSQVRSQLCLGAPPAGIGGRMSTVIKEFALDGWVMYCDGMTARTRTGEGENEKKRGPFGFKTTSRLNHTAGDGGDQAMNNNPTSPAPLGDSPDTSDTSNDPDVQNIVLHGGNDTNITDDVWNEPVGPISDEDLTPSPDVHHTGASKDRIGPDGYVGKLSIRRGVREKNTYWQKPKS